MLPDYEIIPIKVKKKPWSRYLDFKDNAAVKTSIEDVTEKILALSNRRVDAGVCLAVIYLTASRVHEILPWKYKSKYEKEAKVLGFNINKPGFELKNLSMYKDENSDWWWHFKTINLKQNSKKSNEKIEIRERLRLIQKTNYKEIRLPLFGDLPDFKLIKLIDQFFDVLGCYREDLDEVMKRAKLNSFINPFKEDSLEGTVFMRMSGSMLNKYIVKEMKMSPHNLRELRMQHLLRYYRFEIQDLQLAGGWSLSSSMPLRYSTAKINHIQQKFVDAVNKNPI